MKVDSALLESQIEAEAQRQGVDPSIAKAIFRAENGTLRDGKLVVNPTVDTATTSPKGAFGIMQVMPDTFRGLVSQGFLAQNTDMTDYTSQIRAGVAAIKELNSRGLTSPMDVAIGYNASPTVFKDFRNGKALPAETADYVQKVGATLGTTMDTNVSGSTNLSGSSSRSTSVQRVLPPELESRLNKTSSELSTLAGDTQTSLQNLIQQMTGQAGTATQSVKELGDAKAGKVSADSDLAIAQNQMSNNILSRLGINVNDGGTDSKMQSLISNLTQSLDQRDQLGKQLGALQSTDLTQDPVGWFVNNIKALGVQPAYDAAQRNVDNAKSALTTLQGIATNQINIQPAANLSELQTAKQAAIRVAKAEADVAAQKMNLETSQAVARQLVDVMQVKNMDMSQQLALARQFSERFSLSEGDTERQQMKKEEQDMFDQINLKLLAIGGTPVNKATFKGMTKEKQDILASLATGGGSFGSTPGNAISNIYSIIGSAGIQRMQQNNPTQAQFLQNAVRNGMETYSALQNKAVTDPKVAEMVKQAKTDQDKLQLGIDVWMKNMQSEVDGGNMLNTNKNNPFRIDLSAATTITPNADNPVTKFLREWSTGPGGKANVIPDEKLTLNYVASQVADGKMPMSQASDAIREFYANGLAWQRQQRGQSMLGMPVQTTYPVKAGANFLGFGSQAVDLLNKSSIENFLTQQVAAQKRQQLLTPDLTMPAINVPGGI